MRRDIAWICLAGVLSLTGCTDLKTDYGQSKGVNGRNSLNGFGAFRSAYQQAGFRSRDVSRLSDRVRRTDVIVWTPMMIGAIDDKVTRWFDRWLRQGGRTLVYVAPDSGSEADYWMDAAALASPEQRLEYRKRAGRAINDRITWRMNREEVESNGWFRIDTLEHLQPVDQLSGPWASELKQGPTGAEFDVSGIELLLEPYDPDTAKSSGATVNAGPNPNIGPTGPASPVFTMPTMAQPTKTPVDFRPLLSVDAESSIVGEVRSPRWSDSKILVVAGGSLLTNYAFSRPANRRLADQIIAASEPESKSDPMVGFLTSQWGMVPVSDREPGVPRTTGMEMLTEWPISVVTMHGVVLGFIVCLMLFPIFGRPRKLRRTEANDFGHHLDAVAALMKRVGGENYARGRISDYMRRMHGETSGRWVLPERTVPAQSIARSPSLSNRREKQLPLKNASSNSATSDTGQSDPPGGLASASAENRASAEDAGPAPSKPAPSKLDRNGNRDEAES